MTSTSPDRQQPPPTDFKLNKTLSAIKQLRGFLLTYRGQTLDTALAARLSHAIAGSYVRGCLPYNVFGTLVAYAGNTVDDHFARLLAGQLLGRPAELQRGPIYRSNIIHNDQWAAGMIMRLDKCRWRDDRAGRQLQIECFYGQPAGTRLPCKIPETLLRMLAYQIGFSRRMTYDDDPRQFIGLYCWVYIKALPELESFKVQSFDVNSAMKKYNRQVIKCRNRFNFDFEEDPCPYQLEHECWPCKRLDCTACPSRYT